MNYTLISLVLLLALATPLTGVEEAPQAIPASIPGSTVKSPLGVSTEPVRVAIAAKSVVPSQSPSQDRFLAVDNIQEEHVPFQIDHPDDAIIKALYAKVENGKVSWKTLPDKHFKRYKSYSVMSAPPGDYLITIGGSELVRIVGKEQDDQDFEDEDFDNEDDQDLKPEPNPDPEPEPVKVKYAVWIYENQDSHLHPKETQLMKSKEVKDYLNSIGIQNFQWDKDQQAAQKYKTVVKRYPSLVLINQEGNRYKTVDAPKTLEELKNTIKQLLGEKI